MLHKVFYFHWGRRYGRERSTKSCEWRAWRRITTNKGDLVVVVLACLISYASVKTMHCADGENDLDSNN